ncbi:hypothetical protein AVEN_275218-1 [Araneus ventricosus]|uniref:Uncharacterized protein n=1 Tax=Araneus ventricosus TaxID=182803 RepID=A0A4Y2TLV0_ARAVE|nr:hypothetical protein AVEN_275218-1 [Araneus ventricosus]
MNDTSFGVMYDADKFLCEEQERMITSQSKFDVTLDRFASRLAAEFIIFLEFFSLILGVDQLAASRLQLDSRNLPEFL